MLRSNIGVLGLVLCLSHGTIVGGEDAVDPQKQEKEAAVSAAETWLVLVDDGQGADSWKAAAELFRNAVTSEQWEQALQGARGPLGKLVSRKLKSATYATSLPGAPDGQYVVIQFESVFENKQAAIETVTPMLDKDGQWRVSGYFIK